MIRRCYSDNRLIKNPSYKDVEVCDEWRLLSNFKSWMEKQDWEGKELDKDLIGDGKIYSPDNCIFIDHWLNTFIGDKRPSNIESGMIGVAVTGNKYRAQCSNPFGKTAYERRGYIGLFDTIEEAHLAWKAKKHEYCNILAQSIENDVIAEALRNRYK